MLAEAESLVHDQVKEIKFWDENAGLEKTFKHLGLYEKNNSQRSENLQLVVSLVELK